MPLSSSQMTYARLTEPNPPLVNGSTFLRSFINNDEGLINVFPNSKSCFFRAR
ncbi:hypothetical protein Hanom_Chr15g01375501 [Helianthus anomalus]